MLKQLMLRFWLRVRIWTLPLLLLAGATYLLNEVIAGGYLDVWPWIARNVPWAVWTWFLDQEEGVQAALGAIAVAFIFGTAPNRFNARQERLALSRSYSALASRAFYILLSHIRLLVTVYGEAANKAKIYTSELRLDDKERAGALAQSVAAVGLPRLEPLDVLANAFQINLNKLGKLPGHAPYHVTDLYMHLRNLPQANEELRTRLRDDVGLGKAGIHPLSVREWYGDYIMLAFNAATSAAQLLEALGSRGAERMVQRELKRMGDMSDAGRELRRLEAKRRANFEAKLPTWSRRKTPVGACPDR